jgi:hypothetical protein
MQSYYLIPPMPVTKHCLTRIKMQKGTRLSEFGLLKYRYYLFPSSFFICVKSTCGLTIAAEHRSHAQRKRRRPIREHMQLLSPPARRFLPAPSAPRWRSSLESSAPSVIFRMYGAGRCSTCRWHSTPSRVARGSASMRPEGSPGSPRRDAAQYAEAWHRALRSRGTRRRRSRRTRRW